RARPTASADVAAAARRYCNGAKTLQRRDGTAVAQRHRGGAVRSPRSPSFKASRRLSKLLSPSFKAELRFRFEGGSISERALDRRLRRALGAARALRGSVPESLGPARRHLGVRVRGARRSTAHQVFATRQPRKADSPLNERRVPATAHPPMSVGRPRRLTRQRPLTR